MFALCFLCHSTSCEIPAGFWNVSLAPLGFTSKQKWCSAKLGLNPSKHTLFHPSAPLEPTNKKGGDTVPPFCIGCKRQPVVLTRSRPKYRPSAWRYLLACPSYRRRPSQAPRTPLWPGWPSAPTQQESAEAYRSEPPIMCSYFTFVKSVWFGCCISQFLPLSLVSSCRSLVRISPWLIFRILINRKPIDKTFNIIIFHLLHTSHKRLR